MRVLHLLENYPPWGSGGTEIFCARLCQQLKDSGIEVTVALHQAGSLPEPGYYECEGIPVDILPSLPDERDRARSFTRTTVNAVGFPELLDKYQPDILHLHGFVQRNGLTHILLNQGYKVSGTSRDAELSKFSNLIRLGIKDQVKLLSMFPTDFRSVLQVLTKVEPDEVYNLAGQISVRLFFEQPVDTLESLAFGNLNLLEAIRFIGGKIKYYIAGSSECFGNTEGESADETTPFRPRSPYAVAKATAFWETANYRVLANQ
jgi:hypothetical protein